MNKIIWLRSVPGYSMPEILEMLIFHDHTWEVCTKKKMYGFRKTTGKDCFINNPSQIWPRLQISNNVPRKRCSCLTVSYFGFTLWMDACQWQDMQVGMAWPWIYCTFLSYVCHMLAIHIKEKRKKSPLYALASPISRFSRPISKVGFYQVLPKNYLPQKVSK